MKQYIIVDDRFKIGQYLLGIAKGLMPANKSIKIVSKDELATLESPYDPEFVKKVQRSEQEIKEGKTTRLKTDDDIKKAIWG